MYMTHICFLNMTFKIYYFRHPTAYRVRRNVCLINQSDFAGRFPVHVRTNNISLKLNVIYYT